MSLAQLQGAKLYRAQLQSADLLKAQLQGANLYEAELQGANLYGAQLQGADLYGAQLQGADLFGAELQGADLTKAKIWLANFPDKLGDQSPRPLGGADLGVFPLTRWAKAKLRADIKDNITDSKLLDKVTARLYPILLDAEWKDDDRWRQYIGQATEPPPDELVPFLADMACGERGGHIAKVMAQRAVRFSTLVNRRPYAKPLAEALLDENCEGAKALSNEMRTELEEIVAAQSDDATAPPALEGPAP